jgi:hypothetical protein
MKVFTCDLKTFLGMKRSTLLSLVLVLVLLLLLVTSRLAAQTRIIASGSTWKLLDNGSNQGTAWQDASRKSGNDLFGDGAGEETVGINRQLPLTEATSATAVFSRITFSGLRSDAADFQLAPAGSGPMTGYSAKRGALLGQ